MSAVFPRSTTHQGSVLAAGLAIDTGLVKEAEARTRLLELSTKGMTVFRRGTVLVGLFQTPIRMSCSAAEGAPLVRQGRLLSAAPLAPDELANLSVQADTVVLVEAGQATPLGTGELVREDVASWLDLSSFEVEGDLQSLGAVERDPVAVVGPLSTDVRGAAGVPALPEGARDLIQALSSPVRQVDAGALRSFFSGLWRRLQSLVRGRSTREAGTPSGSASWFSRVRDAFARLISSVSEWSALQRLLGARHAEYLARTLEMFESGRLDDALRHAIPLSSKVGEALKSLPWRTPTPRTDLSIARHAQESSASSSIGLGKDLFATLKEHYRRAFARLAAAGDVDRAAFVLTELLDAPQEAIAFLERNNRFRLAAELAEARKLAPGLVIRLWFLAGERAHALTVARRLGAFGDAVVALERTHQAEARVFRMLWADHLASSGAFTAAVDAIWPVVESRHLAALWLERGIEVGGTTGARMLARKAHLLPEAFSAIRDALRAFEFETPEVLATFGRELLTGGATPETRALAQLTARGLLRNRRGRDDDRLLLGILELSGDGALREDSAHLLGASAGTQPLSRVLIRAATIKRLSSRGSGTKDHALASFLDSATIAGPKTDLAGDATRNGVVLGIFSTLLSWEATGPSHLTSRLTAERVLASLRKRFAEGPWNLEAWADALHASLDAANSQLTAEHFCHATVATLSGTTLLLGQVGLTAGFLQRGQRCIQLARDHSLLHLAMDEARSRGEPMSPQQIADYPHRQVVTAVLGNGPTSGADIVQVELEHGDRIVLCSDDLREVVTADQLGSALAPGSSPREACKTVLALAASADATRPLSVVVADVEMPRRLRGAKARSEHHHASPVLVSATLPAPAELRRSAADSGALPVFDAAELPDGRLLVALGELGVWLLARDGTVQTRFVEPTEKIVISDHGDRAILVGPPRDEVRRLSRLDVRERNVHPWCDARLDQFAEDFDGASWFIARGDTVYEMDALATDWRHRWNMGQPGAPVRSVRRSASALTFWLAKTEDHQEVWTYELPSLTLRRRPSFDALSTSLPAGSVSASGHLFVWSAEPGAEPRARTRLNGQWKDLPIGSTDSPTVPCVSDPWLAIPIVSREGVTIRVMDIATLRERTRIVLEGASASGVGVRIQGDHLCAFDHLGRVLVISVRTGALVREHRIS